MLRKLKEYGKPAVISRRKGMLSSLCPIEHLDWNINDYRLMLRETLSHERPDLLERLNTLIDQNFLSGYALEDLLYIITKRSPEHLVIALDLVESMINCKDWQEIMELGSQIDPVISKNLQGTHENKELNNRIYSIFVSVSMLLGEKLTWRILREMGHDRPEEFAEAAKKAVLALLQK